MSAELVWERPPAPHQSRPWKHAYLTLRERPGEWAKVAWDVTDGVYANNSIAKSLRHHGCEVTVGKQPDGKGWSVWARVPPPSTPGGCGCGEGVSR